MARASRLCLSRLDHYSGALSTRTLSQEFDIGKIDLSGVVRAGLRAIEMAIAATDAPAIKRRLA
jgi:hypothetical protein